MEHGAIENQQARFYGMRFCMVAYSDFIADARIKSYVKILNKKEISVDLILLHNSYLEMEKSSDSMNRYYCVSRKYQGDKFIKYIFSYIKFFLLSFFKLSLLFFRNRYKIIHFHNMPNFIVFTGLIPKLFGARLILDIQNMMIPIHISKFEGIGQN